MSTLKATTIKFPFEWANIESYRESNSHRKEIYLKEKKCIVEDLVFLFYTLFGQYKNSIVIYDKSWWDFCLDTWDFEKDEYNYDLTGKSIETKRYLSMLKESEIPIDFSGLCKCLNWDKFLPIVLDCIVNNIAPYSPLFCDEKNDYFFYFHSAGSIGIYYKNENKAVIELLSKAEKEYELKD